MFFCVWDRGTKLLVVGLDHRFSLQHHPCNVYLSFTTHPGRVSFFSYMCILYYPSSTKHSFHVSRYPLLWTLLSRCHSFFVRVSSTTNKLKGNQPKRQLQILYMYCFIIIFRSILGSIMFLVSDNNEIFGI